MDRVYSCYHMAHKLYKMHLTPLAVLIRAFMRVIFACDIPYKATIGKGTCFPHDALGIVIHPDAIIGTNCNINQGVTIGGRSDLTTLPRIGNNVIIGANATVLGDIVIGDNATIGAGAVVIHDVPENTVVAGVPAKEIKKTPPKVLDESCEK